MFFDLFQSPPRCFAVCHATTSIPSQPRLPPCHRPRSCRALVFILVLTTSSPAVPLSSFAPSSSPTPRRLPHPHSRCALVLVHARHLVYGRAVVLIRAVFLARTVVLVLVRAVFLFLVRAAPSSSSALATSFPATPCPHRLPRPHPRRHPHPHLRPRPRPCLPPRAHRYVPNFVAVRDQVPENPGVIMSVS